MTLWPCLCRLACSGLLAPACWHCPPVVDCCFFKPFYFWEPRHWHHTSSMAWPAMPLPLGQDAAAMACLCLLVATVSAGWLFFFINYNFLGTSLAVPPGLLQRCCRCFSFALAITTCWAGTAHCHCHWITILFPSMHHKGDAWCLVSCHHGVWGCCKMFLASVTLLLGVTVCVLSLSLSLIYKTKNRSKSWSQFAVVRFRLTQSNSMWS